MPRLAVAALVPLLAACQSTTSPSPSAVRLELAVVRQEAKYDCGVASIAALCRYWSIDLAPSTRDDLAQRAAASEGLSGDELRAALTALGLESFLFEGNLDRSAVGLYGHIDAGRPPLVMLALSSESRHYALVLGYDEPQGNVILLDPKRGEVLVPAALFERDWARCKHFTLVAVPGSGDSSDRAHRTVSSRRDTTRRISS